MGLGSVGCLGRYLNDTLVFGYSGEVLVFGVTLVVSRGLACETVIRHR